MTIPIANIYYLLSYAWDRLDEKDIVDVRPEEEKDLANLFARVLVSGTEQVLRRGIDRGYVSEESSVPGVRGKFIASTTGKKNLLVSARTWCCYDELSADVLHNQVLKAAMRTLSRAAGIDPARREELRDLDWRLGQISDIALRASHFRRIQLHRNNSFYDFLISICRFVHDNLMFDEGTGHGRFRDFERDVHQMRRLFEDFAFNFFRRELAGYKVEKPKIEWFGVDRSDPAVQTLPMMQTDIVLKSSQETVIIDTKFTPNAFENRFDQDRARTGHLYQVFAYAKNYKGEHPDEAVRGMLLYPVVDQPFAAYYPLEGTPISIRSIDLALPWRQIERDMKLLVEPAVEQAAVG